MNARHIAILAIFALLTLVLLWHFWWLPPERVPAWFAALLHASPMLPAALLALLRRRSAPFWGALGALIMFSHGIMEAWTSPTARLPALIETSLALILVGAASWNGFWARFGNR